ncbi:MAG: SCP2 sterol-binding domain-containing protein [Streptosporangiaceae bacterium]
MATDGMGNDVDIESVDFSEITPEQFAQLVSGASQSQLREVTEGEMRGKVLDEVFQRMGSRFRADKAAETRAVVHWRIGDRSDGGHDTYETVIEDGAFTVSGSPEREPRVTLTLGAVPFLELASGNANGMTMFMTRKLKVAGDLAFAATLMGFFDIPRA